MKRIKLLHNTDAGDEDHSKKELIKLIESQGFACEYGDLDKKDWHEISDKTDLLAIAGGDGTVRKVVEKLLKRKLIDKKFQLAILPLGTANNLAKTLNIDADTEMAVKGWSHSTEKGFDIGRIEGLKEQFFMESVGFGIFPSLMKKMKTVPEGKIPTPDEELRVAVEMLISIVRGYKAKHCRLTIDGKDYSGNYLLAEIMNTPSIGPNLLLAPAADPGDGLFDIVLVTEDQRQDLLLYLTNKLIGDDILFNATRLTGKHVKIRWEGTKGHADDTLFKIKKNKPADIGLEVSNHVFTFLSSSPDAVVRKNVRSRKDPF